MLPPEFPGQNGSVSSVFTPRRHLDGLSMRLRGSYTVEAAIVMGIVLTALCILMQTAFQWKNDTVGTMKLHETVEYKRYHRGSSSISVPGYQIQVSETKNKVSGQYQGRKRTVQLEKGLYEPEEFIRMISLIVK